MSATLSLPKLGLTMEEAQVIRWLAAPGEPVEAGQPVVVVETDKVEVEVCAEAAGYLEPVSQPGDVVPVGATLGRLRTAPGEPPAPLATTGHPEPRSGGAENRLAVRPVATAGNGHTPSWRQLRASMAARALARHRAVDLATVTGTGPGGRIVAADVQRALAPVPESLEGPTALRPSGTIRLSGRRGAVARHLEATRAGAVPLTINRFTACGGLLNLRELAVRRHPEVRPTLTDVAARLVASTVAHHPMLNARATAAGADCYDRVNLAVAVDTDDGLVVPVVQDADRLGVVALASRLRRLVETARQGRLSTADVELGTFTLTNLGAYGVDFGTPVLNWPQVAILGLGRVADGSGGVPTIGLSLTVDHRLVDGVPAARFLDDVAVAFADPGSVLL